MKAQLFIDSIRALITNFQASTLKLINKSSPLSHKIQDLSLSLLQLRTNLLKNILSLFQSQQCKQNSQQKLQKQLQQTSMKLKKLQLHAFLRKKIKKLKKQSMLYSMSQKNLSHSHIDNSNRSISQQVHNLEDPIISKLSNSMLLIQKDLGIQETQEGDQEEMKASSYDDQVRSIISKSMHSLEITPIRRNNDISLNISDTSMRVEQQQIYTENYRTNGQVKQALFISKNTEKKVKKQIITSISLFSSQLKIDKQATEAIQKQKIKQKTITQNSIFPSQSPTSVQIKQKTKQDNLCKEKIVNPVKKKTTVYSNANASSIKGAKLGNLLEQTLVQTENSSNKTSKK